ncbi:MAG: HEAT repeat domain-containing protein [Deltaproteobacteria bacterium]
MNRAVIVALTGAWLIAASASARAETTKDSKVLKERSLATLLDFAKSRPTRIEAALALGKSGDPSVIPPLVELLGRTSGKLRQAIDTALAGLDAAGFIAKDLDSEQPPVRARATFQLMLLKTPKLAPRLIEIAKNDPDPEVRENAVSTLTAWDEASALDAYLWILANDAVPKVRSAAAQGLARIDDPAARAGLQAALTNEPDAFVKYFIRKSMRSEK